MLEVVLLKLKKCGFLFSLVMVVCFALPSFAKADSDNLLEGIIGVDNKGKKYVEMTDNDMNTYSVIKPHSDVRDRVTFDLGKTVFPKMITFKLNKPVESEGLYFTVGTLPITDLATIKVKKGEREGVIDFSSISNKNLTNGINAMFIKFYGENQLEVSDIKLSDIKLFDKLPVAEISGLIAVEGVDNVSFTWKNPIDPEFVSISIYKDNTILKTLDKSVNSYKVEGLEENKGYKFKFVAMYKKETSKGLEKNIKTKKKPMPLIEPPDNVFLTPQDKKMVIVWDDVKSPYLEGYNVYIDGKKINDKPLTSSKLIVKNLENDKLYKVQISAINKENAEGVKSKEKEDKPSSNALEVEYDVKMPFSPLDLLTSSVSLLAILGGFILLSIVIYWFRPLKELIVKAVRREKDKK